MQSYLKYLKKQEYIFNSVAPDDQEKFIIERYLPKYPFKIEEYSAFEDAIATEGPCCSAAYYENQQGASTKFYICLPIFTIDLKTIIHEINHALNINIIGYTPDALIMLCLFEREYSEELVNDFIATLVKEEYIRIGGAIPKALKRIRIGNEYEYKSYIVKYLFECLIDLILESRISGNYNLFYELVGRDETDLLDRKIDELCRKDCFDECLYKELLELINQIYNKVINANVVSTKEYLELAESLGYNIRRLRKK